MCVFTEIGTVERTNELFVLSCDNTYIERVVKSTDGAHINGYVSCSCIILKEKLALATIEGVIRKKLGGQ